MRKWEKNLSHIRWSCDMESCGVGKVMFSQVCVIHSVHRGWGVCRGGGGLRWPLQQSVRILLECILVTFASIILTSSWSCCVRSFASTCTRSVYSWPSSVCRSFLPITTLVLHPCIFPYCCKHICHLKKNVIFYHFHWYYTV